MAIATLDRYVAHPHALGGRSTLAQTLPVRGTSPGALEAAYHLEAIARHIDKLKDAGILREDSHSSSYAGTGAFARAGTGTGTAIGRAANPGVAESIARSRTPGVGSIRTPSPANGTSSTPAPAGGEGYEPASGTNGSPDTAINIDNAQQVADVSQAEIAPPVKSKDHDINAGNVLEGIINRLGVNKSHIPWDKTLFLGILAGFFTFCGGAFGLYLKSLTWGVGKGLQLGRKGRLTEARFPGSQHSSYFDWRRSAACVSIGISRSTQTDHRCHISGWDFCWYLETEQSKAFPVCSP